MPRDFDTALQQADATLQARGMPRDAKLRLDARLFTPPPPRLAMALVAAVSVAVGFVLVAWLAPRPAPVVGGFTLAPADVGHVQVTSEAAVELAEGSAMLDEGRGLRVLSLAPSTLRKESRGVRLLAGRATFEVRKVARGNQPVRVLVSGGAIEVRGTRFTVTERGSGGEVLLHEGKIVFLDGEGIEHVVEPGETFQWPLPAPPPPEVLDELEPLPPMRPRPQGPKSAGDRLARVRSPGARRGGDHRADPAAADRRVARRGAAARAGAQPRRPGHPGAALVRAGADLHVADEGSGVGVRALGTAPARVPGRPVRGGSGSRGADPGVRTMISLSPAGERVGVRGVAVLVALVAAGCLDVVEHGIPAVLTLKTTDCSGATVIEGATQLRFTAKSGDAVLLSRTSPIATVPKVLGLPEATDVQLRVEALDAAGQVIARGSAVHFNVAAGSPPTVSVELFPVDRFTRLCGTLGTARAFHSATLLLDGRVLVVGGQGASGQALSAREVLSGSEVRDVGPLALRAQGNVFELPRARHAASLASSGQVLISGGETSTGLLNSTLIVDPEAFEIGALGPQNPANVTRAGHAAFKLGTDVFLVGGATRDTGQLMANPWVERVDLTTNRIVPFVDLPEPRLDAAMAQLDSVAIIAGGLEGAAASARVDLLTLRAPGVPARLTLTTARTSAVAVTVGDRVLIAGGLDSSGAVLASTEWIRISPPTVEPGPSITARAGLCGVALPGGGALLAGGVNADLIDAAGNRQQVAFPGSARQGQACVSLDEGSVLVIGGLDANGLPLDDLWRFTPRE